MYKRQLLNGIHCEKNPLIASTLTNYLSSPLQEISSAERDKIENELYKLDVYKRQTEFHKVFTSLKIKSLKKDGVEIDLTKLNLSVNADACLLYTSNSHSSPMKQ